MRLEDLKLQFIGKLISNKYLHVVTWVGSKIVENMSFCLYRRYMITKLKTRSLRNSSVLWRKGRLLTLGSIQVKRGSNILRMKKWRNKFEFWLYEILFWVIFSDNFVPFYSMWLYHWISIGILDQGILLHWLLLHCKILSILLFSRLFLECL